VGEISIAIILLSTLAPVKRRRERRGKRDRKEEGKKDGLPIDQVHGYPGKGGGKGKKKTIQNLSNQRKKERKGKKKSGEGKGNLNQLLPFDRVLSRDQNRGKRRETRRREEGSWFRSQMQRGNREKLKRGVELVVHEALTVLPPGEKEPKKEEVGD